MDPELQNLGVQLADAALRNSAGAIADRITSAKARRRDGETIAELENIIDSLQADKNELLQIARAFEEEMVAQRISSDDIDYITSTLVPQLESIVSRASAGSVGGAAKAREALDALKPLLSVETITVMQLLGFNFRRAIGEPLTELARKLIASRAPSDEVQALQIQREILYLEVSKDADAYERLVSLVGRG